MARHFLPRGISQWTWLLAAGTCVMTMTTATADAHCRTPALGSYEYDARFDDVTPMSPALSVMASSRADCAQICLAQAEHCDTFVYDRDTGHCSGLPTRMPKQTEMTTAPGYRLFRRVPACPTEQGYVYHAPLQLCLQFHSHSTWNCYGAVDYCAGRGDQLAILRDPQMVYFVRDHIAAIGGGTYIIGAKGWNWKWVDGTPVETAILNMASSGYDCLVAHSTGLATMWTTNRRYVLCRRDVTGF